MVDRPAIISDFFHDSNTVDKHNHACQHELALEKSWHTSDPWFRLDTSMTGIILTNTWKLAGYHRIYDQRLKIIEGGKTNPMPIKRFTNILTKQLLEKADNLPSRTGLSAGPNGLSGTVSASSGGGSTSSGAVSSLTDDDDNDGVTYVNNYGVVHKPKILPMTIGKSGKCYTKQCHCDQCTTVENKLCSTSFLCCKCDKPYCLLSASNGCRNCFIVHTAECGQVFKRFRKENDKGPVQKRVRREG
jgi:hypothetical protein